MGLGCVGLAEVFHPFAPFQVVRKANEAGEEEVIVIHKKVVVETWSSSSSSSSSSEEDLEEDESEPTSEDEPDHRPAGSAGAAKKQVPGDYVVRINRLSVGTELVPPESLEERGSGIC